MSKKGKRRQWTASEKLRIVLAGMESGVEVSELCRRESHKAESIARFPEWMSGKQVSPRVRNALAALEAIEEGLVDEEDYKDPTSSD